MDNAELRTALIDHFALLGFKLAEVGPLGVDLLLAKGAERWGLALCPDREEGLAYLAAFEAAMQHSVAARREDASIQLGIGLAFASTAAGRRPSYRRALKKYSNSIVFEDLDLSLFLVTSAEAIRTLAPTEVNPFLRNLDRWIADNRALCSL